MTLRPPQSQTTNDELRMHLGGLAAGTLILTAKGTIKIEDMAAGDRVVTRDAGIQSVSMITERIMSNGEVLRVSPAAVGRPEDGTELIVTTSQRLVLRDWRAKAMFGRSVALVSAWRLIDGEYVRKAKAKNLRIFSLHFDALRVVYSGDIELGTATPVTQMFAA